MRKLIFRNTLFHSKYSNFRKNSLFGLNKLKPLMVNTVQKRNLSQFRDFTFLSSNETIQQFSWKTMLYLFFGVPLGIYLYKVWYVGDILLINESKKNFIFYLIVYCINVIPK